MSRRDLRLAQLQPNIDTRDMMAQLMKDAERGDVVGAVIIVICKSGGKKQYNMALAGQAATNPTHALGAVAACYPLLQETAQKQAGIK